MMSFVDMANRLIRFSPKHETEVRKNTTVVPKNVPGRGDMLEAIGRGMSRPRRKNNDYPQPGRARV
jgi:hypothetical protein